MIIVSGHDKIEEFRRAPDEVLSQANTDVIIFAFPTL